MRIAVFTDIHANLPALKTIIDDIKTQNIDRVIFLGDVIGMGPKPKECLDLIIENNIDMVLGNNELYTLYGTEIAPNLDADDQVHYSWVNEQLTDEQKDYLSKLQLIIEEEVNGKKFLFEHFPVKQNNLNEYPFMDFSIIKNSEINNIASNSEYDYTFIGHEHNPFEVKENGKYIIDLGSSGCVKDDKTYYTILDISDDVKINKRELTFSREDLLKDIKEKDYPIRDLLASIFFGVTN